MFLYVVCRLTGDLMQLMKCCINTQSWKGQKFRFKGQFHEKFGVWLLNDNNIPLVDCILNFTMHFSLMFILKLVIKPV